MLPALWCRHLPLCARTGRAAARGAELVARAIAEPPQAEAPAGSGRQYTLNKGAKREAKPKREVTLPWADVQVGQQYKGVVVRDPASRGQTQL